MIAFTCTHCQKKLKVQPDLAGKKVRCPGCQQLLAIPAPEVESSFTEDATAPPRLPLSPSPTVESAHQDQLPESEEPGEIVEAGTSYQVDREIARGGMGAIMRAIDRDMQREVAVKFLLNQADARQKSRFLDEAQITGRLEHPNIVPIHQLGVHPDGRCFFSMKMVKGRSLAQILSDPKSDATLGRLLNILVSICNAMAYAHSRSVIHRDLKPANIMVGDFGEVYVMDWGLAKSLASGGRKPPVSLTIQESGGLRPPLAVSGSGSDLTQEGAIMGTPAYMPPEQAKGEEVDPRADIYSLGAILYEMMTLTPPVGRGGDMMAILMRVAEGTIDDPAKRAPQRAKAGWVPPELSAIAMKALATRREDRYQTVEALQRDIQLFVEGRSVSAKHDTPWELFTKLVKRNKGVSIATGAALVVLLGMAGFFLKINYDARVVAEGNFAAFVKEREQRRASLPSFLAATRLLIDKRDFSGARAQVGLVLELDPEQVEARFVRGQLAMIGQDFTNARPDLEADPENPLAKDLLAFLPRAKANDETTQLTLAQTFSQHLAYAMADGALQSLGANAVEARRKLLALYQGRLEKAWPIRGSSLRLDEAGALQLNMANYGTLSDLSPLRGMPLTSLNLSNCGQLRDLSPLASLPLTSLILNRTLVTDLSPLAGTPLTTLSCGETKIADLSPLKGLRLTSLNCKVTRVADLTPLVGMPLVFLDVNKTEVADLSPLAGMPLTSLDFSSAKVSDLSPLAGMPLTKLDCDSTKVSDLSPLAGMPLAYLHCSNTSVADLTPLKGMSLTVLHFAGTKVTDLSPLEGMPLTDLNFTNTSVADLSPLRGMPLISLNCYGTKVTDLTPLEGMKLTKLYFSPAKITRGLEVLRGMKSLERIGIGLSGITSLPAEVFWQRYDAGEFRK